MTILIKSIAEWKTIKKNLQDKTIGLVPTMGNLHRGHLSLLEQAMKENDVTVLSCFVNPTQFNSTDDFKFYPRTMAEDIELCEKASVDYFFAPNYETMYPDQYRYQVAETAFSYLMEGKHRPGHFNGMLTIVLKWLLLIKPDNAYFGEKDFQQLCLVNDLATAFFLDTNIVGCKTVRNQKGLALSSRNRRLTVEQALIAHYFPEYLRSDQSCEAIADALTSKGFDVDYIEEHNGRRFGAVRLGEVRLIDNVVLESESLK